eukprot:TRINITY_DN40742_c0_g1_i1.p2 TRINITY_DN40742_c0_g1~~TRINITY_DN40742_c0_g1_i1.p2  ORF type:complete len:184 (+),score=28.88 TRINITY_DN40742_c0_g1_i1:93-644(+)
MSVADMDKDYKKALVICAGLMGVKVVLTTLGTVRARLVGSSLYSLAEDKSPVMSVLYFYVFKAMFLVFPLGPPTHEQVEVNARLDPTASADSTVVTFQGMHRNAVEQEPFFMAVAVVYGLLSAGSKASVVAVYVVYVFTACRWLHWLSYLCHLQPWRSITFVCGLVSTLVLSVLMLLEGCVPS